MSPIAAAAQPPIATAPSIVELGPGSVALPKGAHRTAPPAPAQAAATAAVADATPAGPAPAPATNAAVSSDAAPQPQAAAQQAKAGAGLLGRILGIMPLAAGLTQLVLGLMITRGTVSVAAVPLLGALPKFLVGGLVASTAMPSLMGGVFKLLGKDAPAMALAKKG